MKLNKLFVALSSLIRKLTTMPPDSPQFWYNEEGLQTCVKVTSTQVDREEVIEIALPSGKRERLQLPPTVFNNYRVRMPLPDVGGAEGYLYITFIVEYTGA